MVPLVDIQKEIIKNNVVYFYAVMLCNDNMNSLFFFTASKYSSCKNKQILKKKHYYRIVLALCTLHGGRVLAGLGSSFR